MEIIILLAVLVGGYFFYNLLQSILAELKQTRAILEIPAEARKKYDEKLSVLDKEIDELFPLMLVSTDPRHVEQQKIQFKTLVNQQKDVLHEMRTHYYVSPEYLR